MDFLLQWWAAAHPVTRVILMALLPTGGNYDTLPASKLYRSLAARRKVSYLDCRGVIGDPCDKGTLYDGIHPTEAASKKLLRCLAPTVHRLAGKTGPTPGGASSGGTPSPSPSPSAPPPQPLPSPPLEPALPPSPPFEVPQVSDSPWL